MRVGELTRLTGVSRSTIDNYYTRGIISATEENGQRNFAEDSENRVRIATALASFGFKLDEVRSLLRQVSTEEIDERIQSLRDFRKWVQRQTRDT